MDPTPVNREENGVLIHFIPHYSRKIVFVFISERKNEKKTKHSSRGKQQKYTHQIKKIINKSNKPVSSPQVT